MRKFACVLFVVLFAGTVFAQMVDEPIDLLVEPELQVTDIQRLQEGATSEFNVKMIPILDAIKLFPDDQRVMIAATLAEAVGLYVYDGDSSGCIKISDVADLSFLEGQAETKGLAWCDIWYCVFNPEMGSTCFTHCDLNNYAVICSSDMMACCGCSATGIFSLSSGCGGCYPCVGCGSGGGQ